MGILCFPTDPVFFVSPCSFGLCHPILSDPSFVKLQTDYLEKHFKEFDFESKENKLCYTKIHNDYVSLWAAKMRVCLLTYIPFYCRLS
jgi:hypothetical protein